MHRKRCKYTDSQQTTPSEVLKPLQRFTASSCNVKIFLYVREAEYAKFLHAKQDILCDLLHLFEKENVELAYPTQTLFVKERNVY